MQEKIYIESTDEITTVVERLHKTQMEHVVFFVPQRALLLQSSINLRLLQREAVKIGKVISIVTQDEDGALLAEKVGVPVETAESFDDYDTVISATTPQEQDGGVQPQQDGAMPIGSDAFLANAQSEAVSRDEQLPSTRQPLQQQRQGQQPAQQQGQRQPRMHYFHDTTRPRGAVDMRPRQENAQSTRMPHPLPHQSIHQKPAAQQMRKPSHAMQAYDPVTDFFAQDDARTSTAQMSQNYTSRATHDHMQARTQKQNNTAHATHHMRGFGKWFITAGIILFFFACSVVVLPKTTMTLIRDRVTLSTELTIEARSDAAAVDTERRVIGGQLIALDVVYTERFDATGKSQQSDRKARGVITISNTFSTAQQPLVATTRILAENGKLFRLVEGVSVPGVISVDGVQQPGTVKAEVIADAPGDSYNIAPTTFKIPGLQGSSKFDKITATSEQPMRGGGVQADRRVVVSAIDIDRAKEDLIARRDSIVRERISDAIEQRGGGIFLEDTIDYGTVTEGASVATQTAVDQFDYTMRVPIRVMMFAQEDIEEIISSAIAKKNDDAPRTREGDITLDFGDATQRYDDGVLRLVVSGASTFVGDVDTRVVHSAVRGKAIADVESIVRDQYAAVERIDLSFTPESPSFFSRRISPIGALLDVRVQ